MPTASLPSPFAGLSQLPRRDLIAISISLGGIVALSWWYLFALSADMVMPMASTMPANGVMPADGAMPGDGAMQAMPAMAGPAWNATYFVAMFLMWSVMMIGMMVPSAMPTVLIYALVAKKAAGNGSHVAPTSAFVAGYVLIWAAFSLLATTSQYFLDQASLLTAMMASNSNWLAGGLLIVAGAWQFAPLKDQCLRHCRSPFDFISRHWRKGALGAITMGVQHGIVCLGCCWAIMTLLFVGGVMNLLWIAILTIFVLVEKLLPRADRISKFIGALMIAAGLIFVL